MTNERKVELFAKMFDYISDTAGTGEISIDIFAGIGFGPEETIECLEQRKKSREEKVDTQSGGYKKFVVFNPACNVPRRKRGDIRTDKTNEISP